MSKSLSEVDYLSTSASISADLPEILVPAMWHTLIDRDYIRAFAISSPHSSPICTLSFILTSLIIVLTPISWLAAYAIS